MAMLNPWWVFPHTFLSSTSLEIAFRRNCRVILPRTEVRLCGICFLGHLENSKKEGHWSALVNHRCRFCPACRCILSLICLTLVVFLSPECSLRSVGDLRGDLAREDWGKEGIEYLRFFCAFHFFLTIPVQL